MKDSIGKAMKTKSFFAILKIFIFLIIPLLFFFIYIFFVTIRENKIALDIKNELIKNDEIREIIEFRECTDWIVGKRYDIRLIFNDDTKVILHNVRKDNGQIYGDLIRLGDFTGLYFLFNREHGFNLSHVGSDIFEEILGDQSIVSLLQNHKKLLNFFEELPLIDRETYELIKQKKYDRVYGRIQQDNFFSNSLGIYVVLRADDFSWSQWN